MNLNPNFREARLLQQQHFLTFIFKNVEAINGASVGRFNMKNEEKVCVKYNQDDEGHRSGLEQKSLVLL